MEAVAHSIVDESIDEQKKAAESQRVNEFVDGVEERVEERVTHLRVVHGDAVRDVAGKAMAEMEGYRQTQLRIYNPDFKVKDTEEEGAAAWNEKGGDNSIAIGHSGMDRVKDEGYWKRVGKHELVHQNEQAAEFNRGSISYPGDPEPLAVNPVLVEWHAITMANQPDSDLSADYIQHKRRGDALASFLGGSERIIAALKSKDMQGLQDHINNMLVEQRQEIPEEALEEESQTLAA